MYYTLNQSYFRRVGKVIGIHEYFDVKKNDWIKPETPVGTEEDPITDDTLSEFIEKYSPEEICFKLIDRKGDERHVDFVTTELEYEEPEAPEEDKEKED